MRILELNADNKKNIQENLLKRSTTSYPEYEKAVAEIIENVKANKDKAVFDYTLKFDKFALNKDNIKVTDKEIKEAYNELDKEFIEVIKKAKENSPIS